MSAGATDLTLRMDVQGEKPSVQFLSQNDNSVEFEIRIPLVRLGETVLNGRTWDTIELPGGAPGFDPGAPEVPNFSRMLAIPADRALRADFEVLDSRTLKNIDLIPTQGIEPESQLSSSPPFSFNEAIYNTDAVYPEKSVSTSDPSLMRGYRVAAVTMNPIRYNPVTREVQIAHRYRVTVHFEGTDQRNNPVRQPRPISRSWAKIMQQMVLNFDELDVDLVTTGSYLIVCENNTELVSQLINPLVEWKRRKGHTVVVETFTPGSSNSTIKAIIQNAYNTWAIPPEYVLLIGDTSGEYALPGWSPDGIDHPYSQLDGSDILADVAVGRIPVYDAAHAVAMVNKVLWYEKTPYVANSDWYHQGCLVAGSSSSGLSTIQTNRWIKTRMIENEFTRIDTFWYNSGGSSVATTITNAVNNGISILNYRGYWGMENFSLSNINALTNGYKLPFCSIITCDTGGFDGDNFMEEFLTVGTAVTPKGAAAAIGTATTGTNTRCNNTVNYGIMAGLFEEDITQAGNMLVRGKIELYNTYITNAYSYVTNFSNWNALAGDPGLEIYRHAIKYMECTVPSSVELGENYLSLTVNEPGAGPLEDALVCLYSAGQFQSVGVTDATGFVQLPIDVSSAVNVKVTITKNSYYPIVDSLDVVQSDVAVGYYSHSIDDDASGTSNGDGDGNINPGESVEIPIVMKNYGSSVAATSIVLDASTSDPFTTITDAQETFPNIAPGGTNGSLDDLDLTIASDCPHGHIIHLDFVTTANQGSWNGGLDLEVISYDMQVTSAYAAGPDTLLSPGESQDFFVTAYNTGSKSAANLTATIESLHDMVTVNDNSASFGTINVGASGTCSGNPFHLTADVGAIVGDPADLVLTYTSSTGAVQRDTITIYLGQKTSVDPQGPDEYGYYCFDNTDLGYAQVPIYNWIEIDPSYGGSGTELPLTDLGEEQDESVMVPLPFTFRYYGEDVDEILVCTNGWIATDADISYNDFRNYRIPSQIGPRGMIAPFWDDLVTSPGGVFAYNDATNHRFIVEWSRTECGWGFGTNPQEIFEVILYDPVYYSTPTGDGDILFQYNYIEEHDGDYSDNPYSTVGIESPDQTIGIEVVNWETYSDNAAAHLAPGRAYLFTTNIITSGEPPIIGINPTSLSITAPQTGSGSDMLAISNTGELPLSYSIGFDFTDGMGGPDQFGYLWIDSDEPTGPTYNWVDISTTGTEITFQHNDSTTAEIPIGFPFPWYGEPQTNFIVSANGWISFSDHNGEWSNTSIPNASAPRDMIAPFWDDLDPLVGGEVRYYTNNEDSLIVSFIQVPHYGSTTTGTYTFQVILTSDGGFTMQYDYLDGNYQSCTVGMQNSSGTDGLLVAYNQSYLHANLAIEFSHPFLRAVPPAGAVLSGQSSDVEIIAYGYGHEEGTYNATLGIDCNDPVTPHIDVPVTIDIGGGGNPGVVIDLTYISGSPVPVGGGNLWFDIFASNNSGQVLDWDAWLAIEYEGGPPTTVVLRSFTNFQPGWQINRPNTWFPIPAAYAAGNYMFYGRAGIHPSVVWTEDGFPFVKSGNHDGSDFQPFVPENVPNPFDQIITGGDYQPLPQEFVFRGCYPNPFNPVTKVQFDLPSTSMVTVKVYDTMGRLLTTLQDGVLSAGSHNLYWNAENYASGVYFLTFQKGDFNTTEKLLLIK